MLFCIQRSPNLLRNSHSDYSHALNRTLAWVSEHICEFAPRSSSISEDLTRWVNGYLRWRIQDLYSPGKIQVGEGNPIELDQPIAAESGQTTFGEVIADPRSKRMNILDQRIEEIQREERERLGQRLKEYLENDPEDVLKKCHPRKYPECNCQVLVVLLKLSEPPKTMRSIANQFGVDEQTLHHHWRKKCLPLLQIVALKFDPQVKEYIQQDPDQVLRKCYPQEALACNCWELSKRIILSESTEEIGAVAKDLSIKRPILDRHWKEKCLPLLKKYRLEY